MPFPYEIEFHPVGSGSQSGDAITMRYHDGTAWRVIVIDAGYQENGERICEHIRQWYGTDIVDYAISTHPDNDHICGLREVVGRLRVRQLWMHVPYEHAVSIQPLFASRRWTVDGLKAELKRSYSIVRDLVELAADRGTSIHPAFQGHQIGPFTVMSPSIDMYEGLLPQFRATPAPDPDRLRMLGHWLSGIGRRVSMQIRRIIPEDWYTETLREGGITAAENESSVVLYADLGYGGIFLTGDAGLRGLDAAVTYGMSRGLRFGDELSLFQVPHHGSRNNISGSMLDRIIGPTLVAGATRDIGCVISAGVEDETHPRQVVVNALIRRGLKPHVTRGSTLRFENGMRARDGWVSAQPAAFNSQVEAYE